MSTASWLPLRHVDALQSALVEEIRQLEFQLAHFDELPPGARFDSPGVYRELITVRKELLDLLQEAECGH